MGILRVAVVALALVGHQVGVAAEPRQDPTPKELKEISDALGYGFQLREFVVEGKKPDLDALDEFLDLSDFDFHPAANGWRWFDVPYKATKATVHVGLGAKGETLWVRLDLTRVRPGEPQRTALLTKLNTGRPLAQGEYRMASDGLLSLYLGLDTDTVSEGDVRRAVKTLIAQAEGSHGVWRHHRS
jgi:hypothetical protein